MDGIFFTTAVHSARNSPHCARPQSIPRLLELLLAAGPTVCWIMLFSALVRNRMTATAIELGDATTHHHAKPSGREAPRGGDGGKRQEHRANHDHRDVDDCRRHVDREGVADRDQGHHDVDDDAKRQRYRLQREARKRLIGVGGGGDGGIENRVQPGDRRCRAAQRSAQGVRHRLQEKVGHVLRILPGLQRADHHAGNEEVARRLLEGPGTVGNVHPDKRQPQRDHRQRHRLHGAAHAAHHGLHLADEGRYERVVEIGKQGPVDVHHEPLSQWCATGIPAAA